jgi:hypothetical protein
MGSTKIGVNISDVIEWYYNGSEYITFSSSSSQE